MNLLLIYIGLFILLFIIIFIIQSIKIRKLSTKPKNNVHFYVARDDDGVLYLFIGKPTRGRHAFFSNIDIGCLILTSDSFESFGLNISDYDSLKWEDEPLEVFINIKD